MYQPMGDSDVLVWIAEDAAAMADRSEGHGELPVPACPGWTIDDLLPHVGGFLAGWYIYNLTHDPASGDLTAAAGSAPPVPDGHAERVAYLRDGAADLVTAASEADLDATVWAFGGTAPARYWIHRAATELGIHRHDVELARGFSYRIPAERATLSCHETICGLWPKVQWLTSLGGPDQTLELPAGSCTLTASDTDVSWLAQSQEDRIEAAVADRPTGDVGVSGTANDLAMWLSGRGPEGITITGDPQRAAAWNLVERAAF